MQLCTVPKLPTKQNNKPNHMYGEESAKSCKYTHVDHT